jgi:hypothetical protein
MLSSVLLATSGGSGGRGAPTLRMQMDTEIRGVHQSAISPPVPRRKSVVAPCPWAQKRGWVPPYPIHRCPHKYYFLLISFFLISFSDLHPPTESAKRCPISFQASALLKLLPHLAHLPFSSPDERAVAAPSRRAHRPCSSVGEQAAMSLPRRVCRRPSASFGETPSLFFPGRARRPASMLPLFLL